MRVYNRDPSEIHRPLLDPKKYERTYSPDPTWCRILEYYCPQCGTMCEVEYLPPGHPPLRDIELDIDVLSADAAVVRGRWHLKMTKEEPNGLFTLIFKRFPDGWRIVHDHTSAQAPPK